MKKIIIFTLAGFFLSGSAYSQKVSSHDTLQQVLKKGVFEGQVRNFFMTTVNHQDYPDYYAWAAGAGIAYYSPVIKNFQVSFSGFTVYNVASSSLTPNPPFTNRYEVGLFDVTDPEKKQFARVENMYLRYHFTNSRKSYFQFGKFALKTPLVNLQDGRMRPNMQQGVWTEWNDSKKIHASAGWITQTSPRSTFHWYNINESLVYPNGRALNGAKANYTHAIRSKGIFISNIGYKPVTFLQYQLWNYYVNNLFNVALQKIEWKKKINNHTLMTGFQYLWQKAVYSDTFSIEKQYIAQKAQSHSFSGRVSLTTKRGGEWSLNYTRITKHGRFLFPREWGIEPFYTFMQRERNEGAGNVHALMVQHSRVMGKKKNLSLMIATGIYSLPSVNNARLNKYAMPSYYQINARSRYTFTGFFNGLALDVLYTFKGNLVDNLTELPINYHNKVDMHNFSIVLDYNF